MNKTATKNNNLSKVLVSVVLIFTYAAVFVAIRYTRSQGRPVELDDIDYVIQVALQLVFSVLFIALISGQKKKESSINSKENQMQIVTGILSVFTVFTLSNLILLLFAPYMCSGYIQNLFSQFRNREDILKDISRLFESCIFLPIMFEMLCRFVIYQFIRLFLPVRVSIIIQAVLFMLFHFEFNPAVLFLGFYSGILFAKTGDIKQSIYFHIAFKIIMAFYLSVLFFFVPDPDIFMDYWIAVLPLVILFLLIPQNFREIKRLFLLPY